MDWLHRRPIGVMDSGLGGLTVLRELQALMPSESLVYYGDTLNCPYGPKTSEQITSLALAVVHQLLAEGVKAIVVACNTITVTCIEKLRHAAAPVPVIGIAPVVKTAAEMTRNRRIGVLSTSTTAASAHQARVIREYASDCVVVNIGTDELVPRIERGAFSTELPEILPGILAPFRRAGVDTLVLGCSHYPILRPEIQALLGPRVTLIDSGAAISRQLRRILVEHGLEAARDDRPSYRFITSAPSPIMPVMLDRLTIRQSVRV